METNSQKLLNRIDVQNNIVKYALGNDKEVVQCAHVRGGHLKWKYEDWVQNSEPSVRKLIAETYPEYIPLLPCETDWELITVGNYLLEQTKPKLEVLKKFLSKIELLNQSEKTIALQLKYETLSREITAIEKTMSLQQLWQANSPFWTEKLNGTEVIQVLRAYKLNGQSREAFDIESVYNNVTSLLRNPLRGRWSNRISISPGVAKLAEILSEVLNDTKF
jgi:hypothetical protein